MYISIKNNPKYTDGFIYFVIKRLLLYGVNYMEANEEKFKVIDRYLQKTFKNNNISSKLIVFLGFHNLSFSRSNDNIIIFIDDKVKAPFDNEIPLELVCKVIDQGNIENNPFPIFSYLFSYVQDNIKKIYTEFTYNVI